MLRTRNWLGTAVLVVASLFGAMAGAAPVERVSVSSQEIQGNAPSYFPSVSDNGRFVAFCSLADNLVPGDTNGVADTFVRDRLDGTTERVSVSSDEIQANGVSCGKVLPWHWERYSGRGSVIISADGRFVVFDSSATNLVAGDTNGAPDTFVRDRLSGATERVSVDSDEQQLDSYKSSGCFNQRRRALRGVSIRLWEPHHATRDLRARSQAWNNGKADRTVVEAKRKSPLWRELEGRQQRQGGLV